MADVLTPEQRRRNMQRIRSKNTGPELRVRRLVHAMGYRYRLHSGALPGRPDLVFGSRSKVIFVHGCYWHMHRCRYGSVTPRTNAEFWREKRMSNVRRDREVMKRLKGGGWSVLVVWECQLRHESRLARMIRAFIER